MSCGDWSDELVIDGALSLFEIAGDGVLVFGRSVRNDGEGEFLDVGEALGRI